MNELLDYCQTPTEKKYVESYIANGNAAAVAREFNKSPSTVKEQISRVKARAAKKERGQHIQQVPEGFDIKGVSTLYNEDGGVSAQWVKTDRNAQLQLEALEKAVVSLTKGLPKAPRVKAPKKTLAELCTLYTFTDYHLGMFAWADESGDDWDIKIAEHTLFSKLREMMEGSPDSEMAIFNIQGDFLHWDGLDAVTPMNKHVLDADTRFDKLVELALRLCIESVNELLTKHKKVRVLICEGNHDMASSVWLRKSLKVIFSSNSRVELDDTSFPYYAYLHGETMLGFHHGHKKKNKDLPSLFSSEPRYREMWGKAKVAYIHSGHYHHSEKTSDEFSGAHVERHPTLAARDAYAARGGYVSMRAAHAITYDHQGEHSRKTVKA